MPPKAVRWDEGNKLKLLLAIIATSNVSPDWKAVIDRCGLPVTVNACSLQFGQLKRQAAAMDNSNNTSAGDTATNDIDDSPAPKKRKRAPAPKKNRKKAKVMDEEDAIVKAEEATEENEEDLVV